MTVGTLAVQGLQKRNWHCCNSVAWRPFGCCMALPKRRQHPHHHNRSHSQAVSQKPHACRLQESLRSASHPAMHQQLPIPVHGFVTHRLAVATAVWTMAEQAT